ncbi:hypothetical protein [Paenimyroides aestuarii]|uniref:Ribosomal protein L22 n=1 Tax=Paenimyroides aestuarii TaxID=2968490 RepID=A0ABY5NNQ1_9FLAO|nr:hypothetical protein [Paenimyroides aestuarii]UUV20175.1 hypothetical protein NPX36_07310 [Paenimyroides aestuarii]
MTVKVKRIVWVRQAREALSEILDYRYSSIPSAYKIVRKEIISASKSIFFLNDIRKKAASVKDDHATTKRLTITRKRVNHFDM